MKKKEFVEAGIYLGQGIRDLGRSMATKYPAMTVEDFLNMLGATLTWMLKEAGKLGGIPDEKRA